MEKIKRKKNKKTFNVLKKQLTKVLKKNLIKKILLLLMNLFGLLELVKFQLINELKERTFSLKKLLSEIFKKKLPVLYGGSVDGSNVEMFKEIKEIDGFLIGGASKTSKKFIDIIKNYYR